MEVIKGGEMIDDEEYMARDQIVEERDSYQKSSDLCRGMDM